MFLWKQLNLWKLNTAMSLFFVTLAYNGCSEVRFTADSEVIRATLSSSAAIFINQNNKFTNSQQVTLSLTADQADEMMISNDKNKETVWEPYQAQKKWKIQEQNKATHVYVKFRSRGVETAQWFEDVIIHDNIAPTPHNSLAPPFWTNHSIADIEYYAYDNLSGVQKFLCAANKNDEFKSCKNSSSVKATIYLGGLSAGPQFYYIKVSDSAGNISEPTRTRWHIDQTPPTLQFLGALPYESNEISPSFHFLGQDNVSGVAESFCRLNKDEWQSCKSPFVAQNLLPGINKVFIQNKDKAGNMSAIASHSWKFSKKTQPILFDMTQTPLIGNENNLSVHFYEKENEKKYSQFRCRLNEKSYQKCNEAFNISQVKHGLQTFRVVGLDSNGKWSPAFSYKFLVDRKISRPEYFAAPPRFTKNKVSQFDVLTKDSDIINYYCKLDANEWELCPGGSSPTYHNLKEGPHSLQVKVEDQAKNISDASYYNWVYDTTSPKINISEKTNAAFSATTQFILDSNDNITSKNLISLECKINESSFSPCHPQASFSNLTEGDHHIQVRASDQAGNTTLSSPIPFTVLPKPSSESKVSSYQPF